MRAFPSPSLESLPLRLSLLSPLLVSLLSWGSACTSADDDEVFDEPNWPMAESNLSRDQDPELDDVEIAQLRANQEALGLDIYHQLRQTPDLAEENFSLSPYSLAAAMGMVYGGTVGQAREEMEAVLHFNLGDERQHVAHNWIDQQLLARNLEADENHDAVIIAPANGVWVEQSIASGVESDFLDLLAVHYGAGLRLADFFGDSEGERLRINAWVEARTHGLIPELLPANTLEGTLMAIINALYLAAPWQTPFETTLPEDFTLADGSQVSVDTLSNTQVDQSLGYSLTEDYEICTIDLRGGALEFVVIEPQGDFATFEAALDQPTFASLIDEAHAQIDGGSLFLPRFSVDAKFSLREALISLGMPTPFASGEHFTGISPALTQISDIIQQTTVKVDEGGIEAAATTVVLFGDEVGSGGGGGVECRIDKPFIFAIRDSSSDTLLFLGRVLDPR
ncbi:serpin family protein [Pseudenhygromyxa sp. WMMC2535]|uniref:serpin family protein n=1 Tax=Pseudenhygromyxa sp. WMMC2535 TaxID=2712867 RepID=UPI00155746E7|nr:serpin family protein [Pseudenhygromyxa sp. WMMC2535]NVB38609.1 serpin family protein [Pseudenhygromyxa sp. WMMC2535]